MYQAFYPIRVYLTVLVYLAYSSYLACLNYLDYLCLGLLECLGPLQFLCVIIIIIYEVPTHKTIEFAERNHMRAYPIMEHNPSENYKGPDKV